MKISFVIAKPICFLTCSLGLFLLSSCTKQDTNKSIPETKAPSNNFIMTNEPENLPNYNGLSRQTLLELQQARTATAKYRNIANALADGYADINVVVPNMGYHFMKSGNVDALFEIRKPEILVYNKNQDGSFELVAVEYAVPLALSPDAPEGFSGSDDVWERNETFGLWLQHAWIWSFNPDGAFHDTNPLIHVF